MSNGRRPSTGRGALEPLMSSESNSIQTRGELRVTISSARNKIISTSGDDSSSTPQQQRTTNAMLVNALNGEDPMQKSLRPGRHSSFSAPHRKKVLPHIKEQLSSKSVVIDNQQQRGKKPSRDFNIEVFGVKNERPRSNSVQNLTASTTTNKRVNSPLHLFNGQTTSKIRSVSLSKSVDASLPSINAPHRRRRTHSFSGRQKSKGKKKRSSFPQIPGLPKLTKRRSDFFSYSDLKPLHERISFSKHAKRVPPEKIFKVIKRDPSGAIVIRVGGGYVVVSDNWDAFLSHGDFQRAMNSKDFVPDGVKIKEQLEDGTLVLDDGTLVRPDGTRVFADGTQLRADGTWVDKDGNVITDPNKLAQLNDKYSDAVAQSRACSRRGTMNGAEFNKFRRKGESNDLDHGFGDLDDGPGTNSDGTTRGNNDGKNGDDSDANDNNVTDGGQKRSLMSRLGIKESWNLDDEVVEILPDGSRVLADGTIINADGTITLADGTVLSKEEARKLTRKRKSRAFNNKKNNNGNASSSNSSPKGSNFSSGTKLSVGNIAQSLSAKSSRMHSRKSSDVRDLPDAEDDDGVDIEGRQRRHRFPKGDPYGFFAGDVSGQIKPGKGVCALDYLSRYCILPSDHLQRYRQVFDSLDSDGDGEISKIELEFGVKTVNKHFISHKELDYVDVVLDVQRVRSINFRMFALISALSERVVGLDSFVKNLVNTMDARALARKILGTKDLFYILDEQKKGVVGVDDMSNELVAGRISKEHEVVIIDKFTEDGKDEVGFLDFLTYIPLFLEIHDTINDNPFETKRDK
eukprot:m.127215 g.127215  ORF g.127215 m.127215 type:complete len:799 (+) comp13003_c0_seq2:72-2468(+)